ncbi:MAG: hypothetical protein FJZ92_02320 [Chloroflexi bacterium]|nr:hypothetical protein [Chloroflexota bacterium]
MSNTHAARPTDLVALVTFDGEVRENMAITRERLGLAPAPPRPLNAAIEQWLGLGRQTWITVRGRQVHGIATARELSERTAWQIDTLIDAESGDGDVLRDLLRQAARAADRARVSHVLLRTRAGSAAVDAALRAGFVPALQERLWGTPLGHPVAPAESEAPDEAPDAPARAATVRPATDADTFPLFQLSSRALPIEARQVLAMTMAEWKALRERRWCARGESLVALDGDRVVASLRAGGDGDTLQVEIVADPGGRCEPAADALFDAAIAEVGAPRRVVALVPASATAVESVVRARGLAPESEFVLLARRTARPIREAAPARAGVVIPTGG